MNLFDAPPTLILIDVFNGKTWQVQPSQTVQHPRQLGLIHETTAQTGDDRLSRSFSKSDSHPRNAVRPAFLQQAFDFNSIGRRYPGLQMFHVFVSGMVQSPFSVRQGGMLY